MTDAAALSGDEMAALMNGLDEHDENASGGSSTPRPYVFGQARLRPVALPPALERMSERMARRLRGLLEPFARVKPQVTAEPVAIRRFEAWRAEKAEFTSLSLYSMRPLKGGALIAIEPDYVGRLVDAFYGGSGAYGSGRTKEFTATEERLLSRLTEALAGAIAESWAEMVPVKPNLTARETNIAYASLVRDEEAVAVCRFVITPPNGGPTTIDILYPAAVLRAVEGALSAKVHDEGGSGGREWRDRMASALRDVRLEARSVLARPTLSVAELMRLKAGDVIPISVPSLVPLLVAGRQIGQGRIGDHDGRAALRIEKIQDGGSI